MPGKVIQQKRKNSVRPLGNQLENILELSADVDSVVYELDLHVGV